MLVKCQDCGGKLAKSAYSCPHCHSTDPHPLNYKYTPPPPPPMPNQELVYERLPGALLLGFVAGGMIGLFCEAMLISSIIGAVVFCGFIYWADNSDYEIALARYKHYEETGEY